MRTAGGRLARRFAGACAAAVWLAATAPLSAAPLPPASLPRSTAAPLPKPAPHTPGPHTPGPQRTGTARRPRLPPAPLPMPRPPELAVPPATAGAAPQPRPEAPAAAAPATPTAAPAEPTAPPPDAAAIAACRAEFAALGGEAKADEEDATPATGACAIPGPVTFSHLHQAAGPDVTLDSAITVRCTLAVEIARWVREDLAPIAKTAGSTLTKITGVGGHACRPRNNQEGAQISEHASGNAFDLLGLTFADGRQIALWQAEAATREIRAAVKTSACARFRTVLGPGADSSHANHLHLDMRQRRADFAMCQWTVE